MRDVAVCVNARGESHSCEWESEWRLFMITGSKLIMIIMTAAIFISVFMYTKD